MTRNEASELLRALFESWRPSLLRYALRTTGSLEAAEDAVQEAFMSLYSSLREGRRIDNPKGWTLRAVRNQVCLHYRAERRHGERVDSAVLNAVPAPVREPELWKTEADEVTALFSVLTQREEEVILLRMQTLKYREIAEHLGISHKSVATLLARAIRKLQRAAKAKLDCRPAADLEEHVSSRLH